MTTTVVFCLQEAVASVDAHRQKGGSGAVGDITQMPSGKVVTGGADGHVAVLDPRRDIVTLPPPRRRQWGEAIWHRGGHFLDSIDEISEVVSWRFQGFAPSEVSPVSGRIVAQLCAPRPSHRAHTRVYPT